MNFCIVGTGRCGTTLLFQMLNAHPDVFVFNETHWLPTLHEQFGNCSVRTSLILDIVRRTHHVTGEPVTKLRAEWLTGLPAEMTVVEFCNTLGDRIARQQGKSVWADKTPDYGFFISTLQHIWPDCRVIHVIRDGLATVRSMSRHIGFQALAALDLQNWTRVAVDFQPPAGGFPTSAPEAYVDLWYHRLRRIQDEARWLEADTYMEVRFEDLLQDPQRELNAVACFLDLDQGIDWIAQAASLVDPKRGARLNRGPPKDFLPFFDAHHCKLLRELGYDT